MRYCDLVAKLCLTLCNPMDFRLPGSSVHGVSQARIPGCHFLLQGTQGSNPGLPYGRQMLYPLSHQGIPTIVKDGANFLDKTKLKTRLFLYLHPQIKIENYWFLNTCFSEDFKPTHFIVFYFFFFFIVFYFLLLMIFDHLS